MHFDDKVLQIRAFLSHRFYNLVLLNWQKRPFCLWRRAVTCHFEGEQQEACFYRISIMSLPFHRSTACHGLWGLLVVVATSSEAKHKFPNMT